MHVYRTHDCGALGHADIGDAAQDCDSARVLAWLDSGGDINDRATDGCTLLHCCALGGSLDHEIRAAHVSLARTLIEQWLQEG